VDNSSNSRADAAYDKALAAYQEKSYEVARRWVVEALAHNRQHSGARTLLGRLDAARNAASPFHTPALGSEVVSTDPTILISRASGPASAPESIEPTVMVRRDDPRFRSSDTDPRVTFPPLPPPRTNTHPVSEPTIIGKPKPRTSPSRPPKSSFSLGATFRSLGDRFQRRDTRAGQSSRSTGSVMGTPTARGALLAVGTVLVGALLVWGLFAAVRWVWPTGQLLTINKPTGGTISGPGIECGSRGTKCSAMITTGEPIELSNTPDKGYVWSGYTGDCAPTGRTTMAGPHTCGATFDAVESAAPISTFRLTITKPEGGTIVAAGGILCGTNGSTCSTDIPSGAPVSLKAESDDGYQWQQFTGDCPSTGEMIMSSARTCGATFIRSASPSVNIVPPAASSQPRPRPQAAQPNPGTGAPQGTGPAPGTGPGSATASANPQATGQPPTNPQGFRGDPASSATTSTDNKPPPPPISADDHAKQEILQLVKNYCDSMGTLKPDKVRPFFHLDNERDLKARFKEYKSLKCTLAGPPEYDRLDSGPAGAAQLKFGMKQAIQMASGGAPATKELMVTMVVSRRDFQSPWLIDRVLYEEKPK